MKIIISFLIFFCVIIQINAQNGAAINTTGAAADVSAIFDASSNSHGILIPRLTTYERDNNISNPAEGLQIFNTDTKCFEYYAYGIWQQIHCAVCPAPLAAGNISGTSSVCEGDNGITYSVPIITNAINYVWNYSGIGATINGSSNTITIDFASNATSGNLTVKGNNQCGDGVVSNDFSITVFSIPSAPIAGTHTATQNQIIWNWNTVSGAIGYKFNTVNNYNTAIDNSTNTSYTQTSLSCNTSYSLYVWAYNNCGVSSSILLNKSTQICCGPGVNVTFLYRSVNVTYGTALGQNNTCWLDRNLGATKVASNTDDTPAYGDLFQWGRLDDGHQVKTSNKTSVRSSTNIPGHSNFITTTNSPLDWRSTKNDNLWQGASGINNPCPSGWRLPTYSELTSEINGWAAPNRDQAFNSTLKWASAGGRSYYDGALTSTDYGYSWSSTTFNDQSYCLIFGISQANMTLYSRSYGFSVRCIKD